MPLELKGPRRKELRVALLKAFPSWNELRRMLADELDWTLATITAHAVNLEDNVFDVIEWAAARGLLADLIVAARNVRPRHDVLAGFGELEELARASALSATAGLPRSSLEKIVSGNAVYLDVARWSTGLVQTEWRVCRIDDRGEAEGTGFLVGPDLVLTNHHVVERLLAAPASAASWTARFDYKRAADGKVVLPGRTIALAAEFLVDASPPSPVDEEKEPKSREPTDDELDFALLRLATPIADEQIGVGGDSAVRGFVALPTVVPDYAAQRVVAILGHPLQRPMKLALDLDQRLVLNAAANRIRYTVPTEPGSSGSPVFDSDWNLVALHHGSDPRYADPSYNEGIPIGKIVARPKVAAALAR